MPHLILEYTDNIEPFAVQPLLAKLHEEMVATGAVNLKGLKSRAICHADYHIGDGDQAYAFVHVQMWIRDGRSHETKQEMAQRAMTILEETFGHRRQNGYLSLSVDIQELAKGIALTHHNIPENVKRKT